MNKIEPVGIVVNECDNIADARAYKEKTSTIVIEEKYSEGLYKIEKCPFIDVIFYFHLSEFVKLVGKTRWGEERGVFASRSPKRPNYLGITTVKLIHRDRNVLTVQGLDAVNGTPVVDIKCCDTTFFAENSEMADIHRTMLEANPRVDIRNNILSGKTDFLLLKAGQLHGHFCPGLSLGVMAATRAMMKLNTDSDGMEDLLAIVETNNCFSDGVQFVTGCSFGNNSLIYHDLGKTAFTLTRRNGKGIRFILKPDSREYLDKPFPEFNDVFNKVVVNQDRAEPELTSFKSEGTKKAFGILSLDFEKIFEVREVDVDIPDYAPIRESVVCSMCGENVMKTRTIQKDHKALCFKCANQPFGILDGEGIH